MSMKPLMKGRLRFAPSPNGFLHLGHGYSAYVNIKVAQELSAELLLRIEDIDHTRARLFFIDQIYEDLKWLGFSWQGEVLQQSLRHADYQKALVVLAQKGIIYPCFCSRKDIQKHAEKQIKEGKTEALDPDGAPHYPGTCRHIPSEHIERKLKAGADYSLRINLEKALEANADKSLTWHELSSLNEAAAVKTADFDIMQWGDAIIKRKDLNSSYHLSVVVDDASQHITHVIRGEDLYASTVIHRLLQNLLDLPEPLYYHHQLITDYEGEKLSKSKHSKSIKNLRQEGLTREDMVAYFDKQDEPLFAK